MKNTHNDFVQPIVQKDASSSTLTFYIDKIEGPCLQVWLGGDHLAKTQQFTILVNERVIGCDGLKIMPKEDKRGVEAINSGFQITIPGYVWDEAPLGENLDIQLLAGELPAQKTVLTRKGIVEWIESLVDMPDNNRRQYFALLAFEHLCAGGFSKQLSPKALHFMQAFISLMGLANLVPVTETNLLKSQPVKSLDYQSHKHALWILNQRLSNADAPDAVFATVVDVMHELELDGEIKLRYIDSVIPTLCRHGVFTAVPQAADFFQWHTAVESVETCGKMSITLAALVINRKIPMATGLLLKWAKQPKTGWINTECIHFAVQEFNRQYLAGQVAIEQARKFSHAVFTFVDSFQGGWFSRLHDRELIQSVVAFLNVYDTYTDYWRQGLIKSLIRIYGLAPEFWKLIDSAYPDFNNSELARARKHWLHLCDIVENDQALDEQLDKLLLPLSYFHAMGNLDTVVFLREIVMNSLATAKWDDSSALQVLIEMLLKDTHEGLRIAAFPLNIPNNLPSHFPECSDLLLQSLRVLSNNPYSVYYQAQTEAGLLSQEALQAFFHNDHKALSDSLKKLRRHAHILHNHLSQYLSIDLLILAYELGRPVGLSKDSDLGMIKKKIIKIIGEIQQEQLLPVPIQAAVGRLHQYKDNNGVIRDFLADIQLQIQEKFGDGYDFLFKLPPVQVLLPNKAGFPTDTLVVIYSCRKYLNTRIDAIRNTWIQDLNARHVPYLVLVGDGDDTISGDVLALNVSDKYEDLPHKTLKLFDWVMTNTSFQYVYKIDDDCYLDVFRFFDVLTYRKHLYYGRIINRPIGSFNRTWHQSKSHTHHAQKVLDKSPEPSAYADGGGGYVLSRYAMMHLQKNAKSEAGEHLISVSLMEDKLVGDLLALSGITPKNEDYQSYQRRRTFAEAVPVDMYDCLFYPSPITPTVMVHLDNEGDLQGVYERHSLAEIWPKKVWPTGSPLLIKDKQSPEGWIGANQLELLTTPEQLKKLLSNSLVVVVVVRNEMVMLPHFLNHYRQQGVRCFLMVDNLSDDGTREYLLEQPDVGLFSASTQYKNSHYGVAWQQALLGNFCLNKWVLLADADELLVYPDCETLSLADFISVIEREGADCVRTDMIDMYPFDNLYGADLTVHSPFTVANWFDAGSFEQWRLGNGFYSNSQSLLSTLRCRIVPGSEPITAQKYALLRYKPWMRLSQGLHDAAGVKVASQGAWFAHFKFHAAFKQKVEDEIHRGQHFDNANEYIRYAELLSQSDGAFGKENVSVCYESSADLSWFRRKD